MNWKLLIILLFCAAAGYAIYMGVTFYFANPYTPVTIEGFIAYVGTTTLGTVDKVTVFVQDKLQWIIASIGSIVTVAALAYRTVRNKITGIQQTYENRVDAVQTSATQQYNTMQATITTQADQIKTLGGQVETLTAQASETNQLREELAAKTTQIQTLIGERNSLASMVETLKVKTYEVLRAE